MFKLGLYRKKRVLILVCISLVWLFILILGLSRNTLVQPVSANIMKSPHFFSSGLLPKMSEVLFLGIPGLSQAHRESPVKVTPEMNKQSFLHNTILYVTNIDMKNLKTILNNEIPLIGGIKTHKTTVSAVSLPDFPKFDAASIKLNGKPSVGIYHTHTSESFIPVSGVSHQRGGQMGDIAKAGEAMKNRLEKNGIKTLHSQAIHDYPSFMKAYSSSELTVKNMLEENPSIQMVFDIHRDAEKRENVLATIDGVSVARLLIVVATGQEELLQPHWQQNYAFAKLIDAKLNQHFPGLSRGIQLVDWRYNQHLHPRALLIEVGSHESTGEEAVKSMEMFADVITEIFAEGSD